MKIKFKKGSKIHIKDSQKGSFTKYCNGKVTEECIQKGKNSPDPKIRKKATFAANARKWNHKDGGKILKGQLGTLLLPIAGRRKLAEQALKGLGIMGEGLNTILTSGASSDFGQTSPFAFPTSRQRTNIAKSRESVRKNAKKYIEKASPYLSPSNYIVALTQGSGDPRVGAQKIAEWGPEAQLAGAGVDYLVFAGPKGVPKGVRTTTANAVHKGSKAFNAGIENFSRLHTGVTLGRKILKDVYRNANRPFNFRNYRYLVDPRFIEDLHQVGEPTLMKQRTRGTYPLTYPERKAYVKSVKHGISEGARLAAEDANKTLSSDIGLMFVEPKYRKSFDFGLKLPKIEYGTRNAMSNFDYLNKNLYPEQANYAAYYQPFGNTIYVPFRYRKNSLQTNPSMQTQPEMFQLGGHETRHSIQNKFQNQLDFTENRVPDAYNCYTNYYDLPKDLVDVVNKYIDANGNYGKWTGALSEMDAEMAGWRIKYGYPKLSKMNLEDLDHLKHLFRERFGREGNVDSVFKAMSEAGYWKKGGKLK